MRIQPSWCKLRASLIEWSSAITIVGGCILFSALMSYAWVALFPVEPETIYEDRYVPAWIDSYRDYVVRITSEHVYPDEGVARSCGSGYVLVTGEILTAYHVVEDDTDGDLLLERWDAKGRTKVEYHAYVVRFDKVRDIALLELRGGYIKGGLTLGSESDLSINKLVHIVGCPSACFPPSLSSGILRAEGQFHILIDSGLWYGHSGGPIIDGDSGRIIGMAVQIGFRRNQQWLWGEPQTDLGIGLHVEQIRSFLQGN